LLIWIRDLASRSIIFEKYGTKTEYDKTEYGDENEKVRFHFHETCITGESNDCRCGIDYWYVSRHFCSSSLNLGPLEGIKSNGLIKESDFQLFLKENSHAPSRQYQLHLMHENGPSALHHK
jgi:hypothetical protein